MRAAAWTLLAASLWLSACVMRVPTVSPADARDKNQLDWEIDSKPGDPKPAKATPAP